MDIIDLFWHLRTADITTEFIHLHDEIDKSKKDGILTDELLNRCDDSECSVCGIIVCPYGDFLHFHHDGCPSCSLEEGFEEYTPEQIEALNASDH